MKKRAAAPAARGVRAAPAVRALASKLGVDLSIVTPSGPDVDDRATAMFSASCCALR
mgnify:CR=1 FL=1